MNDIFDQNEQVVTKKQIRKEPFLSCVTRTCSTDEFLRDADEYHSVHKRGLEAGL